MLRDIAPKGRARSVRRARSLRAEMTLPEVLIWKALRNQPNGLKFRRQHPFGDYVIDFVCLEAMLAIEVDGGQHGTQQSEDEARTEYLKRAGFRVLRFWNNEVMSEIESVTTIIWRALQDSPTPIPAFPLKGKE